MIDHERVMILHLVFPIIILDELALRVHLLLPKLQVLNVAITLQPEEVQVSRCLAVQSILFIFVGIVTLQRNINTLSIQFGVFLATEEVRDKDRAVDSASRDVEVENDVSHTRLDVVEISANDLECFGGLTFSVGQSHAGVFDEELARRKLVYVGAEAFGYRNIQASRDVVKVLVFVVGIAERVLRKTAGRDGFDKLEADVERGKAVGDSEGTPFNGLNSILELALTVLKVTVQRFPGDDGVDVVRGKIISMIFEARQLFNDSLDKLPQLFPVLCTQVQNPVLMKYCVLVNLVFEMVGQYRLGGVFEEESLSQRILWVWSLESF